MKRPKFNTYPNSDLTYEQCFDKYVKNLENYIDVLEECIKTDNVGMEQERLAYKEDNAILESENKRLMEVAEQLIKALDKACHKLEQNHAEFVTSKYKCKRNATKEEWKEWCFKDD